VAAVVGMRGALEAARVPIKGGADGYIGFTFSEWIALLQCVDKALTPSLGADMLKRLQEAEGLLKRIQDWLPMNCSSECSTCQHTRCKQYEIYHAIDAHLKGAGKE
jgi:hypothetical protein